MALIGIDGSGKTTVAHGLIAASDQRMKYLYMGIHVPSANFSLPTSRLLHAAKVRAAAQAGAEPTEADLYRAVERSGPGSVVRLILRVSEEMYRQVVSWIYQARGYIVVYDRHFVFEYSLAPSDSANRLPTTERIHRWFLRHVYPKPDLVVMLDVPPEVAMQRVQEWSIEHHRRRRARYLNRAGYAAEFVTVDGTLPLADVVSQVHGHVERTLGKRSARGRWRDRET